jgi:hypothetical protein
VRLDSRGRFHRHDPVRRPDHPDHGPIEVLDYRNTAHNLGEGPISRPQSSDNTTEVDKKSDSFPPVNKPLWPAATPLRSHNTQKCGLIARTGELV